MEPIYESSDAISLSSTTDLKDRLASRYPVCKEDKGVDIGPTLNTSPQSSSSVQRSLSVDNLNTREESAIYSVEKELNANSKHTIAQQQLEAALLLQQILASSNASLPSLTTDSAAQCSPQKDNDISTGDLKRTSSVAVIPVDGNTIKRIVTENGALDKVTSNSDDERT